MNDYTYNATLNRSIDGDTFIADVDLGFYATLAIRVRVAGVNTPELHGGTAETRAKALESKAWTERLLLNGFTLKSYHDAKSFDRWVCDVWALDGVSLADSLISNGLGEPMAR